MKTKFQKSETVLYKDVEMVVRTICKDFSTKQISYELVIPSDKPDAALIPGVKVGENDLHLVKIKPISNDYNLESMISDRANVENENKSDSTNEILDTPNDSSEVDKTIKRKRKSLKSTEKWQELHALNFVDLCAFIENNEIDVDVTQFTDETTTDLVNKIIELLS